MEFSRLSPRSGERGIQRRHVRAPGRDHVRDHDHDHVHVHVRHWRRHCHRQRYCRRCPSAPKLALRPPLQLQTVQACQRPALTEACVFQSCVFSYLPLCQHRKLARKSCRSPDTWQKPLLTGTDHHIVRQHPSPHQQTGLSGQQDARARMARDKMGVAHLRTWDWVPPDSQGE